MNCRVDALCRFKDFLQKLQVEIQRGGFHREVGIDGQISNQVDQTKIRLRDEDGRFEGVVPLTNDRVDTAGRQALADRARVIEARAGRVTARGSADQALNCR